MKVSIVTITSNDDGNVEVSVKPFSTFEKAAKYLYNEFEDIKSANEGEEFDVVEVNKIGKDSVEYFFMETTDGLYWVDGNVYTMEVE